MLQVLTIVVGLIETNCYLAVNELRQTLLIDPGAEPEKIIAKIEAEKLTPVAILNTHGHYDHILANMSLKQKYQIPIYFPETDRYLLPIMKKLYPLDDFAADNYYQQQIQVQGFDIQVLPTPGHSKGSSCFLLPGVLFSGDTIFAEGYLGRTDLWGGSQADLQHSLKKLLELPDNTEVYPGHGPKTTIGAERSYYG